MSDPLKGSEPMALRRPRTSWTALLGLLVVLPLSTTLSGCSSSETGSESGPIDETELPENEGVEYGEAEAVSASVGGLMRFDDDNLRILFSDFDEDTKRGSFAIMHKNDPDLDRDVIAPNGTVLVVGEYRVELEANSDGGAGFGYVSKAANAG